MPHALTHTLDAIVIGAGLGGIAAAAALLKAGARDVLILEKGASAGGVWRDCDYPGARCDVASSLYSYSPSSSLSPPGWAWAHTYGGRDEILAYVRAAADGSGAARRVRTHCRVSKAAFDEAAGTWEVTWEDRRPGGGEGGGENSGTSLDYRTDAAGAAARAGDARVGGGAPSSAGGVAGGGGGGGAPRPALLCTARARVLFAATGLLGTPAYPTSIAGLLGEGAAFRGPVFHSARWDWGARLGGARVVVVGAGASAAQIVPALADPAVGLRSLTLCLRSAPTVIGKGNDAPTSPAYRAAYARLPWLRSAARAAEWAKAEARGWALTGRAGAAGRFSALPAAAAAKGAAAIAAAHRAASLRGAPAAIAAALTPRHPLGCKRVLLSDTFLATLARDPRAAVETGTLVSASAHALHLADGRAIPADVVVLCTGFVAPAWLSGVEVVGRGGHSLAATWRAAGRAGAYCGTAVPGFPNFFMLGGPGSGTGNHSALAFMEAQVCHAVRALTGLLGLWGEEGGVGGRDGGGEGGGGGGHKKKGGGRGQGGGRPAAATPPPPPVRPEGSVIEVRADVAAAWDAALAARVAKTAFTHCSSWYREGGGTGAVTAVWPGSARAFVEVAGRAPGGVYAVVGPPISGAAAEEEEGGAVVGEVERTEEARPGADRPPDQPPTPTRWWGRHPSRTQSGGAGVGL